MQSIQQQSCSTMPVPASAHQLRADAPAFQPKPSSRSNEPCWWNVEGRFIRPEALYVPLIDHPHYPPPMVFPPPPPPPPPPMMLQPPAPMMFPPPLPPPPPPMAFFPPPPPMAFPPLPPLPPPPPFLPAQERNWFPHQPTDPSQDPNFPFLPSKVRSSKLRKYRQEMNLVNGLAREQEAWWHRQSQKRDLSVNEESPRVAYYRREDEKRLARERRKRGVASSPGGEEEEEEEEVTVVAEEENEEGEGGEDITRFFRPDWILQHRVRVEEDVEDSEPVDLAKWLKGALRDRGLRRRNSV